MDAQVVLDFGFEILRFFSQNSAHSNAHASFPLTAFLLSELQFVQPHSSIPYNQLQGCISRPPVAITLHWYLQKEAVSRADSTTGCEVTNTLARVWMRLAKSDRTMIKRCCNKSICCMQQTQLLDKLPHPPHSSLCSKWGLENLPASDSKPRVAF